MYGCARTRDRRWGEITREITRERIYVFEESFGHKSSMDQVWSQEPSATLENQYFFLAGPQKEGKRYS